MTCDACREALSARADGEADDADLEMIDAHVEGCASCRDHATRLDQLDRRLRVRVAEPVPDLVPAVLGAAPRGRHRARWVPAAALLVGVVGVAGAAAWSSWVGGGSAEPPALAARAAVVSVLPASDVAAVYLAIDNDGGADELVGVSSPDASAVSLHGYERDDDLVYMAARPSFALPADTDTVLQPGGAHLMLEGLEPDIGPGDEIEVTLEFDRSPPVTVRAAVVRPSRVRDLAAATSGE